jgi:hypothetical protein
VLQRVNVRSIAARYRKRPFDSTDSFVLKIIFSRIPNDEELDALVARTLQETGSLESRKVEFSDLRSGSHDPCVYGVLSTARAFIVRCRLNWP